MSLLPTDPGFDFRAAWYEGEVEGKTLLDAIDTLRAQLEAADADWREKLEARTIDWSEASNALYVWRHRAKDAEARAEAAEAECARLNRDVADLYEAMPSLPIAAETMDAATDWFTRYCVDFHREINAAQDAARTKEQQA